MTKSSLFKISLIALAASVPLGIINNTRAQERASIDLAEFQKAALDKHNEYRDKHRVEHLELSDSLNKSAQEWAEHIASTGKSQHSATDDGENIAMSATTNEPSKDGVAIAQDAISRWYNEERNYNYATQKSTGGLIGHFTQIVWKDTTKVGCGVAQGRSNGFNRTFVVCQYSPAGNVVGRYEANVLKP